MGLLMTLAATSCGGTSLEDSYAEEGIEPFEEELSSLDDGGSEDGGTSELSDGGDGGIPFFDCQSGMGFVYYYFSDPGFSTQVGYQRCDCGRSTSWGTLTWWGWGHAFSC
ncbi:hypothetical protein ACLESO_18830 [Pyxidicoccus sp. 3LG]